ncbi:MAG: class I SAM-dependent methyltransferase [Patescibacteria group bacterium]|nr:class I SAM-dependent methyltransferase [Patescibacteria group bacterium]
MSEIFRDLKAITKYVFYKGNDGIYADPLRYDRLHEKWFSRRSELARGTAEVVTAFVKPNGKICEAAAGTGILSLQLAERGFCVTCTYIQPNALEHLQNKAKSKGLEERITTDVADMNGSFPIGNNTCDCVVQLRANRYIIGNTFYTECHRVLNEDGVLILPVFTIDQPIWWKNAGRKQHITPEGIANDLIETGFKEVEGHRAKEIFSANNIKVPPYYVPSEFLVARK